MLHWLTRRRKTAQATSTETVLICEDDYGVREAYKLILSEQYELKLVASGREALKILKRQPIKAMILDLKMPEMDGLTTLRQVREASPGTHVIISTGYKSVEIAEECSRLGCDDYIIKPFHSSDVLGAVKKALTLAGRAAAASATR